MSIRPALCHPRHGQSLAYVLLHAGDEPLQRLWSLVITTCSLPLLQHWRNPVMQLLSDYGILSPPTDALGPVIIWRLAIAIDALELALGELIRDGTLTSVDPVHP